MKLLGIHHKNGDYYEIDSKYIRECSIDYFYGDLSGIHLVVDANYEGVEVKGISPLDEDEIVRLVIFSEDEKQLHIDVPYEKSDDEWSFVNRKSMKTYSGIGEDGHIHMIWAEL